jgi:prolyl-tRNA synthetase
MQQNLFDKALAFRQEHTRTITNRDEFVEYFTPKKADNPEIHGGFAVCHFTEGPETEAVLAKLKVTIRCIPINDEPGFETETSGACIFTGQPTTRRAVFAKAY